MLIKWISSIHHNTSIKTLRKGFCTKGKLKNLIRIKYFYRLIKRLLKTVNQYCLRRNSLMSLRNHIRFFILFLYWQVLSNFKFHHIKKNHISIDLRHSLSKNALHRRMHFLDMYFMYLCKLINCQFIATFFSFMIWLPNAKKSSIQTMLYLYVFFIEKINDIFIIEYLSPYWKYKAM